MLLAFYRSGPDLAGIVLGLTFGTPHIRFLLRVLTAFYADTCFLAALIASALEQQVGLIATLTACSPLRPPPETMHADAVPPAKWA
jgi:hypothetical protein